MKCNQETAAICGLFCGTCPAYPNQCKGCLSSEVAADCQICGNGFRDCAVGRGITRCYECSDFPCARLEAFRKTHVVNGIGHHTHVIENLKQMKERGVDAWVEEQEKKHTCEKCGRLIPWFEETCKEKHSMNHVGTVLIETERLILRRFKYEDSAAIYRNWTSDDRVTKFLTWPIHQNVEVSEQIIQMWVDGYKENNYYQWAIVPKGSDEPIGSIGAVHQNEAIGMLHIGYCIGYPWWNQGYTSEALAGIISFLFEQVKANRIESRHDPKNPNSGKVMVKCGLTYEGTLRQADVNNQGIVDVSMYGILAEDYFAKKNVRGIR